MASKGYTTKVAVENYTLTTIDNSFDSQIDDWISAVETQIEQITGRVFVADAVASARRYNGDGSREIRIDDAVEITQVRVGDTIYTADESGDGDEDEYTLYPANGLPKNQIWLDGAYFSKGAKNVKVTAKWGYSVAVPADVKFAATVMVAGIINFANSAEGEVQSMSIGRYSVTYKTDQEKKDYMKAADILATYKRMGIF